MNANPEIVTISTQVSPTDYPAFVHTWRKVYRYCSMLRRIAKNDHKLSLNLTAAHRVLHEAREKRLRAQLATLPAVIFHFHGQHNWAGMQGCPSYLTQLMEVRMRGKEAYKAAELAKHEAARQAVPA